MMYDPRPDLLYLKERIDKLEKAVVNILEILDVMTRGKNEQSKDED